MPLEDNYYKLLGTISHAATPNEIYQLFSTYEREWKIQDDLDKALSKQEFRDRLSSVQRIKFASLLAITHIYFATVRVTTNAFRPVNFVYYTHLDDDAEWNDEQPYVLNPYISIGFGSRKPHKSLGSSSGVNQPNNTLVAELGLLLYQIGSSSKIDYGQGREGFRRAREEAIAQIHAVELGIWLRFAEITLDCLEWKPKGDYVGLGRRIGG